MDRKRDTLVAHAVHAEPKPPRGRRLPKAIRRELERLAAWRGASDIEVRSAPDAWRAVLAAVAHRAGPLPPICPFGHTAAKMGEISLSTAGEACVGSPITHGRRPADLGRTDPQARRAEARHRVGRGRPAVRAQAHAVRRPQGRRHRRRQCSPGTRGSRARARRRCGWGRSCTSASWSRSSRTRCPRCCRAATTRYNLGLQAKTVPNAMPIDPDTIAPDADLRSLKLLADGTVNGRAHKALGYDAGRAARLRAPARRADQPADAARQLPAARATSTPATTARRASTG